MALNVGELFANLTLKTDHFDKNIAAAMNALAAATQSCGRMLSAGGSTAGRMFSSGLASGIRSGQSAVISAAIRVAQAAVSAANARLKIASPSRVMEESGAFFAEGFAKGIRASAAQAASAAANMAGRAASSAKNGNSRLVANHERQNAYLSLPDMALYMDGKRLAQISAADTYRAQAARSQRLALGYGINRR